MKEIVLMGYGSFPLGYMQYLNAASRVACVQDDFSKQLIYRRYLKDLPNHNFGSVGEEQARSFLSSAIRKLSTTAAAIV